MTLPHLPAAVIFDMDGLIFDTEALYQAAFLTAADEAGHAVSHALIAQTIGVPWEGSRGILLDALGGDFPIDAYRLSVDGHFARFAQKRLALKPGVIELLDLLDALGLPRCIATSSAHATVQSHLGAHRLGERFRHVVAHGDYAASKPAPDPFLMAAARLGVEPALCLALEDSHNGVRSAVAAGMMTIMVPDLLPATPEMEALCTAIVDDLHVVHDLVLAASMTAEASALSWAPDARP